MNWWKKRRDLEPRAAPEPEASERTARETPKNTLRIEELEERIQIDVVWGS
jgi:hypothetical protein